MIRNIVFDMGQVLIYFNQPLFFRRMRVPEEDWDLLGRELFRGVEWTRTDRGTIGEEEAFRAICSRLPARLHPYVREMVFHWWEPPLAPVEGMGELVAEVKGAGYGVYLLSNASSHLHSYFSRIPGSQYFDGKIVSADWKVLKPEREIYRILFREYGLEPEECLFIDDQPQNVEAGCLAGMKGIVFHGDIARLRKELQGAGVPVSD